MKQNRGNPLDVAIVGGGVSGLYAAWRLAADSEGVNRNIALYEASDRLGGRLWSVRLRSENAIPAELGGMFFSDGQSLVYDLCTKKLALETESVTPRPDFAYLRSKRFRISEFEKPGVPPYELKPDEQGLPYHQLLFSALERILPDLKSHWPFNADGTFAGLVKYLQTTRYEGRPLYQWGFWNLLAKSMSNEAYLCLRDIVSSFALFSNWNAYDACLSLLGDMKSGWHRLPGGYQELPDALAGELPDLGVSIRMNSPVSSLAAAEDGLLKLTIENADSMKTALARRVILALPKAALSSLAERSSALQDSSLASSLDATKAEAACKIFLTFDKPWWRDIPDGPGKIAADSYAVSHTDLPMRQCYYLGCDESTGEGLMLASYSDGQSVPFWSALMNPDGHEHQLTSDVPEPARREIGRQLSEMHGTDIPNPKSGIFVNWSVAPYGGGWHAWQPGWQSYTVMASLRRPDPDGNISICGEAISAYQGWVEGALTSAELLLQEQFGLSSPEWLSSDDWLTPYRDLA